MDIRSSLGLLDPASVQEIELNNLLRSPLVLHLYDCYDSFNYMITSHMYFMKRIHLLYLFFKYFGEIFEKLYTFSSYKEVIYRLSKKTQTVSVYIWWLFCYREHITTICSREKQWQWIENPWNQKLSDLADLSLWKTKKKVLLEKKPLQEFPHKIPSTSISWRRNDQSLFPFLHPIGDWCPPEIGSQLGTA